MVDLHMARSDLLNNYRLFVTVGHSEYWSKEMRDNVEQFVKNGGNAAFFSGNTCFWQVRIEDDGNTLVCYKDLFPYYPYLDPVFPSNVCTVNWNAYPVCRPSTTLTGVSWSGSGPSDNQYIVENADHWVFEGVTSNGNSIKKGDRFGSWLDDPNIGPGSALGEVDHRTEGDMGRTHDLSDDCTNHGVQEEETDFHKLAIMQDSSRGEAVTMGIFFNGLGTVFTASIFNWTRGLSQNGSWGPIDQITLNVLNHLQLELTITVPNVFGLDQERASAKVKAAGLVPIFTNSGSVVWSQKPSAGSIVIPDSSVTMSLKPF